jgi:hypothetical protein
VVLVLVVWCGVRCAVGVWRAVVRWCGGAVVRWCGVVWCGAVWCGVWSDVECGAMWSVECSDVYGSVGCLLGE